MAFQNAFTKNKFPIFEVLMGERMVVLIEISCAEKQRKEFGY